MSAGVSSGVERAIGLERGVRFSFVLAYANGSLTGFSLRNASGRGIVLDQHEFVQTAQIRLVEGPVVIYQVVQAFNRHIMPAHLIVLSDLMRPFRLSENE